MRPRIIKKNNRLSLVKRPDRKTIHGSWKVGEVKMVSIPVGIERHDLSQQINIGRTRIAKDVISDLSSARWVFALVRRDGPKDFIVVQRCIGAYSDKNPGQRVLDALAKEFGLSEAPKRIIRIRPQDLG